jgi:four helix bundle protein
MVKADQFEKLEVWKASRCLASMVYRLSAEGGLAGDASLRNQLRRAAISVMSNIAEGFERNGNREFVQFLALAKGSCGELRSELFAALDGGYLTPTEFEELYALASETSRLLAGLLRYIRDSSFRGVKFRQSPGSLL